MKVKQFLLIAFLLTMTFSLTGRTTLFPLIDDPTQIVMGAERTELYFPFLKDKKVAVVANPTSIVNGMHLVDMLVKNKITVTKVFAPEHGFRGEAGPGDKVNSGKDSITGINVISLYGTHKKPTAEDLKNIDYVIFDIQDVGARFYTFISTLQYVMEACAENNVSLIVLDRPNPNGFYVDGPVLDTAYSSFVGMAPVPIVHGLTVGEYANMVNGEGWLAGKIKCTLEVIKMKNYTHQSIYALPVKPSPNLPEMISVYMYPSLCLFEGTVVSVGRGTAYPFRLIGYPGYKNGKIKFTPEDIPGVISNPPYKHETCNGICIDNFADKVFASKKINLDWLIEMYNSYPEKEKFFTNFFDKLAGNSSLRNDIISGKSTNEIRAGWEPALSEYKSIRIKYLLYKD